MKVIIQFTLVDFIGSGLNGENDVTLFVERIAKVVEMYNLDGVDLGNLW